MLGYQAETHHGATHVERWTRALAAFGHGSHSNPMTAAEAQSLFDQNGWVRWQPVAAALAEIEAQSAPPSPTDTPVPTNTPLPTDTPVPTDTPIPTDEPLPLHDAQQSESTDDSGATTFTVSPSDPVISSGTSGRISLLIKPSPNRLRGYVKIRPSDAAAAQMAGISLTGDNGGSFGQDCGWDDPDGSDIGNGRTCHVDYNWPASTGNTDELVLEFVEYTDDSNEISQQISVLVTLSLVRADAQTSATATPIPRTYSGSWGLSGSTISEETKGTLFLDVSPSPAQGQPGCAFWGYMEIAYEDRPQAQKAGISFLEPAVKSQFSGNRGWTDSSCHHNDIIRDGYRRVSISYDFIARSSDDAGTVKINFVDKKDGVTNIHHVGTITMVNTIIGPDTATGNFWIERRKDDYGDGSDGVINEGGIVWMRVWTDTDPGDAVVGIEASKCVRDCAQLGNWSNWAQIPKYVAVGYDTVTDGRAGKGLYSRDIGKGCVWNGDANSVSCANSNWIQDGNRWYTYLDIISFDDNFIEEALRKYRFRVKDSTNSQSYVEIAVYEDDGHNGDGASPQGIYVTRTIEGLEFDIWRGHYEGYTIKVYSTTNAWNDWSIPIAAGEQSFIKKASFPAWTCNGGPVWVTFEVNPVSILSERFSTPVSHIGGSGPLQVCK